MLLLRPAYSRFHRKNTNEDFRFCRVLVINRVVCDCARTDIQPEVCLLLFFVRTVAVEALIGKGKFRKGRNFAWLGYNNGF
jgi:hypothetical protein